MLRSAPRFLAQHAGVSVEIVNWPGLEAGDMSHLGFSELIIGQRYCTTGTPTLKKLNRSIRSDEKTIFAVLFITMLEPLKVVLRSHKFQTNIKLAKINWICKSAFLRIGIKGGLSQVLRKHVLRGLLWRCS
ncbi:MAG: hypothetical protein HW374_1894 [Bacteroidetes bacterium]|nr:hypothetical protein [Bacteroidota bacterium]